MKRLTTVVLLCTLAVVTIFTATSCKGMLSTSKAPSQPGLYIDTGFGYKSGKEVAWADAYLLVLALEMEVSDFQEQVSSPMEFRGSVIKIATRSMGLTYQQADEVLLFPLAYQPAKNERDHDKYVCYSQDVISKASMNESRPEQNYTYVEIQDIPESSSGLYCLYVPVAGGSALGYDYKTVFLRRSGS